MIRAGCFRQILENYAFVMEEWDVFLSERLQPDLRARIIGCTVRPEWNDLTFSLVCILVSGQRLANLTKEMLTKMPTSDQSFDHYYANVSRKSEGLLALVNQRFQDSDALWPDWTKLPPNR